MYTWVRFNDEYGLSQYLVCLETGSVIEFVDLTKTDKPSDTRYVRSLPPGGGKFVMIDGEPSEAFFEDLAKKFNAIQGKTG